MAFSFKFPDVGEGITEGELVKWLVKVGDVVKEDQNIAEIETDKAVVQIPSPKSGIILELRFKDGDAIKVGDVIAVIGEKNEAVPQQKNKDEYKGIVGSLEEEAPPKDARQSMEQVKKNVLASPATRSLAKKLDVDITAIKGSGKGGMITKDDVSSTGKTVEKSPPGIKVVRKYDFYGYVERVQLKGVRKAIARHMSEAYSTIPHVTHMDTADITKLVKLREREKKLAKKKGIKLTFLPFVIKALISTLKEHPYLNASLENDEILIKKYYNIGIAVDTEHGLMVPVIKRAETKSMLDLAKEIKELAEKARKRTIDIIDLQGSSFTITNIGSLGGGTYSTPIINSPDVANLGLGAIREEPVAINGKIKARHVLHLSLSFDHRVLDGAEAAKFMNTLIDFLEDPGLLLVES